MARISIFFIAITLLWSCGSESSLSPREYLAYSQLPRNVLNKQREIEGVIYTLRMQLPEYSILAEEPTINEKRFKEELAKRTGDINFVLLMEDVRGSNLVKKLLFNQEQYGKLLEYANTDLVKHLKLMNGDKLLDCRLVHVEPANSIQPVIRMSFGFEHCERNKEVTISFDDHFFNNGEIKFQYERSTINDLPQLKF